MTPSLPAQESERGITIACRELTDIEARLTDMDRLGIENQVNSLLADRDPRVKDYGREAEATGVSKIEKLK
jgi:hypothetical protein